MLYTHKPKYFLSLGTRGIQFDENGEFNTTEKWEESVLDELGATKVETKKTKNK